MPFEIIRQDITKMQVDAIVNSTSAIPSIGRGVDRDIHEAAGPDLFKERMKLGNIEPNHAVLSKGYLLPSKFVIHVNGPIYLDGLHQERENLNMTYLNALQLAQKHQITSIAFPLLSSGTYQFPRGEALEVALSAIKSFLLMNEMRIILVVYDEASYQLSLDRFLMVKNYLEGKKVALSSEKTTINRLHKETVSSSIKKSGRISRSIELMNLEIDETFAESLLRMIDERDLTDVEVYKKANIDRKLFSKIRKNSLYQPSKMTVIAFAIALELNLDQTKDLLNRAGFSLSPSSKFDKIIQYFLEEEIYDLYEINQVLFAFDQKVIGGLE